MRVIVAIVATTLGLTAAPAMAGDEDATRYLINEQFSLSETAGSDMEKLRTARYGLNDPNEDDYERVPDELRVRWKLNKLKMRVPLRF